MSAEMLALEEIFLCGRAGTPEERKAFQDLGLSLEGVISAATLLKHSRSALHKVCAFRTDGACPPEYGDVVAAYKVTKRMTEKAKNMECERDVEEKCWKMLDDINLFLQGIHDVYDRVDEDVRAIREDTRAIRENIKAIETLLAQRQIEDEEGLSEKEPALPTQSSAPPVPSSLTSSSTPFWNQPASLPRAGKEVSPAPDGQHHTPSSRRFST